MKYKKRTGHLRAATIIVALVAIALAGLWWRQMQQPAQPSNDQPQEQQLQETVDRGLTPEGRERLETKIAETQQAIAESEERDISLILQLGNQYYSIGELGLAVDQYNDILSTHPDDTPALENKGQALLEMGDFAGAEAAWLKAISLSPQEHTYLKLDDLYREHMPTKYNANMGDLLEEAVANIGQTSSLMVALGNWHKAQGNIDRAISHYEVAVQLNPDNEALKEELQALKDERDAR